jgi:hypothetical protein
MEVDLVEPIALTSPAQIQAELTRIWDSLEGTNKMRASLFNLIFYIEKNRRDPYLHTIAQKVIEKFPSRVIFITVDKSSKENYLKTSVSVLSAGKGESSIACDLIQIDVAGNQQMRVPFVILPHILADLPIYLVWAEDPNQENPLSYQFEQLCSRLIFDSEATDNLPNFAKTLLNHHMAYKIDIADLNWARMESWRTLFSTIFYSPERLDQLLRTKLMTIVYNSHETASFCHTRIQAIYLQAWLSSQLNWTLKNAIPDKSRLNLFYQKEDQTIQITIAAEDYAPLAPGTIVSVDLKTIDEDHFSFVRNPKIPNHISMKIASSEKCEIPCQYIFSKGESGKALVREICHKGTSLHYLKVLTLLSQMQVLELC